MNLRVSRLARGSRHNRYFRHFSCVFMSSISETENKGIYLLKKKHSDEEIQNRRVVFELNLSLTKNNKQKLLGTTNRTKKKSWKKKKLGKTIKNDAVLKENVKETFQ